MKNHPDYSLLLLAGSKAEPCIESTELMVVENTHLELAVNKGITAKASELDDLNENIEPARSPPDIKRKNRVKVNSRP